MPRLIRTIAPQKSRVVQCVVAGGQNKRDFATEHHEKDE